MGHREGECPVGSRTGRIQGPRQGGVLEAVGHAEPVLSHPRLLPPPMAPNLQGTVKFKGQMSPPSVPPQHFRMRPVGVSQAGKIQVVTQETPHPALSLRTREEKDPQREVVSRPWPSRAFFPPPAHHYSLSIPGCLLAS